MVDRAKVVWRARIAIVVAFIAFIGMLLSNRIRLMGSSRPLNWSSSISSSAVFALFAFLLLFLWGLFSDMRSQPVLDILEDESPESRLTKQPLSGFVAMEFFWLILNRTYVVFVAPEGLYGWRAEGPVTNANKRYFEPYQQMLEDPGLMRDLVAIKRLSKLRGGFFWRSDEITSVSADDRSHWGMGGVVHSGHVRVRLVMGASKNFIILGEAIPMDIRDRIISTTGAQVTSGV